MTDKLLEKVILIAEKRSNVSIPIVNTSFVDDEDFLLKVQEALENRTKWSVIILKKGVSDKVANVILSDPNIRKYMDIEIICRNCGRTVQGITRQHDKCYCGRCDSHYEQCEHNSYINQPNEHLHYKY